MAKQSSTTSTVKTKDKSATKVSKKKGNENAPPAPVTPTSSARKDVEKTRKGNNPRLQSLRDAEKEIEILKKQLELAESRAQLGSKKTKYSVAEKTPRPKGSFGSKRGGGQSIKAAMGLDKDAKSRQLYKAILYSAHACAMRAGIDFDLTFLQQEDEKVAKFCRAMREEHEILRNYNNHWAAKAVLQQYITNRRKNEGRKEREALKQQEKRVGKAKASDDTDIDEENQSAEEGSGAMSDDGVVVHDMTDDDDDDVAAAAAAADDSSSDDD
ncbi:hypothetical protein FA95DRAFT_1636047 [Auriscalpium vulgare]|uniref:Uncharacterized protein n=1 Tax=Auriscalpium vulgare TaxID=40419 RepID=A0ACB8RGG3_9AGAM|nr:hypothetical protein FA95DRAFT_1636047 [Auriscalpium vulgare]